MTIEDTERLMPLVVFVLGIVALLLQIAGAAPLLGYSWGAIGAGCMVSAAGLHYIVRFVHWASGS